MLNQVVLQNQLKYLNQFHPSQFKKHFKSLPDFNRGLTQTALKRIDSKINVINSAVIEPIINAAKANKSRVLNLAGVNINRFPSALLNKKQHRAFRDKLLELHLNNNALQTLRLEGLPELWFLSLSDNPLKELEASIADLPNLEILHCSGTKLDKLPEGKWAKLGQLNCGRQLKKPDSLETRFGKYLTATPPGRVNLYSQTNFAKPRVPTSESLGLFWQFVDLFNCCKRERNTQTERSRLSFRT
ncbi:MAG: hypothetical protein ACHQJ6_08825 [Candidatus Berkiellales bacterium]